MLKGMPIIEMAGSLGVGNTPLLRIRKLASAFPGVRVFAKAEWTNPGGSIKDRPALRMVLEAQGSGRFKTGDTLLDSTSGNTGIAYAWLGARLGFKVRLAVPGNINPERKRILLAYGAALDLTSPLEGSDGAIRYARALYEEDPAAYFYPAQYNNPDNWKAHYHGTGPEIWEQTEGSVTHFVAGLGTSGTFRGVSTSLKERNPALRAISVQPEGPLHGLEGLKHMETSLLPGIYDPSLCDEELFIGTEEAQALVRRAAREEGLLIGNSSGANLAAALRIAEALHRAGRKATVVTVFPDGGERYLGERFWEDR